MLRNLFLIAPLLLLVHVASAVALPACKGSSSSSWTNCHGTYVVGRDQPAFAGDKYVGEFKNGMFHGQGTYYYLADNEFKGDKYVGEFRDGKKHGQGTAYYLSNRKWKGAKYVCQFRNDMSNGQGTYTFPDNSSLTAVGRNASGLEVVGEFVNWWPNGNVTLYWGNGDVWVGRIRTSEENEEGTWLSGKKYAAGNVPREVLAKKNTADPSRLAREEFFLWLSAEDEPTSEQYQKYLDTFPDGACVDLARKRVKETRAWEETIRSYGAGNLEGYLLGEFLKKFGEAGLEEGRKAFTLKNVTAHWSTGSIPYQDLIISELTRIRSRLIPVEECRFEVANPDILNVEVDPKQNLEPAEIEAVEAPPTQVVKTNSVFDAWKTQCQDLGLVPGTESFGQCVLRLMDSEMVTTAAGPNKEAVTTNKEASGVQIGQRLALVIGNASYTDAPLANPLNDSELMSWTLRDLGFEVTLVQNVTQIEMKQAIVNFGIQLEGSGPDAVGLFYFAGHGVQVRGRNYLMPVGTPYIGRAADVDVFALDANEVLDQMHFAGNAMNVVVLDACRNNPYFRRFRGNPVRGLARMEAPRGTIIAYSTRPGDLASDGIGNYSPYTEALVRAMRVPGLSLSEVFIQTRVAVMEATQERQVPWEEGGLTANFYFNPIENRHGETN